MPSRPITRSGAAIWQATALGLRPNKGLKLPIRGRLGLVRVSGIFGPRSLSLNPDR